MLPNFLLYKLLYKLGHQLEWAQDGLLNTP